MADAPTLPPLDRTDLERLCDRIEAMTAIRLPELLRAAAMLLDVRDTLKTHDLRARDPMPTDVGSLQGSPLDHPAVRAMLERAP